MRHAMHHHIVTAGVFKKLFFQIAQGIAAGRRPAGRRHLYQCDALNERDFYGLVFRHIRPELARLAAALHRAWLVRTPAGLSTMITSASICINAHRPSASVTAFCGAMPVFHAPALLSVAAVTGCLSVLTGMPLSVTCFLRNQSSCNVVFFGPSENARSANREWMEIVSFGHYSERFYNG